MKTKEKTAALNGAVKPKKTAVKKETFAEIAKKAVAAGGKAYKEGRLKPL